MYNFLKTHPEEIFNACDILLSQTWIDESTITVDPENDFACYPWLVTINDEIHIAGYEIVIPENPEEIRDETAEFLRKSGAIRHFDGYDIDELDPDIFSILHEIGHCETLTLNEIIRRNFAREPENYYADFAEVKATKWALEHYNEFVGYWQNLIGG